jgi:hypothetical protein
MPDSKVKAISSFLSLCEKATIDMNGEGLSNALKAAIVLCMKFVDKEALFRAVLPQTFVDWVYVRVQASSTASSKKNMLGDASTWLHLMQFVEFGEPSLSARVMQSQYPPLYCIHAAIGALRAQLTFSDACKILLFNNVEGLTSRTMIELHTSTRLGHNTYTICTSIVNALADERHGADVYESTFKYVIGTLMKVDEQSLAQHIAHFKLTAAARVKAWEMKAIQSRICRPSMRRVAESMASMQAHPCSSSSPAHMHAHASHMDAASSSSNNVGGGGGGMEGTGVSSSTFDAHSVLVRYPNSMSNLRRLRCYLLACQSHNFSYQDHLHELVSSDVARALADNPVTIPEPHSLYAAVESLAMNMRPFPELDLFRTRCFVSFASHQKRSLTLTQVLKLYVAAYQVSCIFRTGTFCMLLQHPPPDTFVLASAVQAHLEAALDHGVPRHLATDHPRRRDVCGIDSVCR